MLLKAKMQKGSSTVEAAILFPIIMISIAAVLYAGFILSERCSMQAAADTASESGSSGWKSAGSDVQTGKIAPGELSKDSLYWRIIDSKKGMKTEKAAEAAGNYPYGQYAVKPVNKTASASLADYVVYKKLSVQLKQEYLVPVHGLLAVFGLDDRLNIGISSASVVNEPAELIRNTDFVVDLEKELEEKYPAVRDIGEKTRGTIDQLKEKISRF